MEINQRFWKTATVAVGFLSLFLLILSINGLESLRYVGKDIPVTNTITVTGTGDIVAVPDVATFSFGVTETAKAVADAQSAATTKINSAIKALTDAGVSSDDIKTLSYNINPHYDYQASVCTPNSVVNSICPPSKSVLTGYDVSQTVQVKVRDLTKAGALFATVGNLGVENVDSLQFSIDQPETLQDQARSKAITDAKTKADTLAAELGVRIVGVTSFSESNGNYYPVMMTADSLSGGRAVGAVAPSIPAGQQKITSQVSVTYQIQ